MWGREDFVEESVLLHEFWEADGQLRLVDGFIKDLGDALTLDVAFQIDRGCRC